MKRISNSNRPKGFKFTPLRRSFFELLIRYVNLTTNDFYRLVPRAMSADPRRAGKQQASHERTIRHALRMFAGQGFLVRRRWFDDERTDTPFPVAVSVYSLSKEGLRLAREKGIGNGRGKHAEDNSRRNESVEHELAITRFHFAVDSLPRKVLWRQVDLKRTVNPDALFEIVEPDGRGAYYYFLEIEKSKQGNYRDSESGLIKKLRRYYEYQGSEACKHEWNNFNRFRVVVVVKNDERRKNLLLALAEMSNTRFFWITTEPAYQADISGAIFLTSRDHRERAYSLIGSNCPPVAPVLLRNGTGGDVVRTSHRLRDGLFR
jgi:Replication-relaxation